jgi:hypothetical protein
MKRCRTCHGELTRVATEVLDEPKLAVWLRCSRCYAVWLTVRALPHPPPPRARPSWPSLRWH